MIDCLQKTRLCFVKILDLVELELRELLDDFGFDQNSPIINGSALLALNGDRSELGEESIVKLLEVIDTYIPDPQRDTTSPFVVPIDNAFLLPGRGTVIVGTISKGVVKRNDEAELLGFDVQLKTTVSDIQVFKKSIPQVTRCKSLGFLR